MKCRGVAQHVGYRLLGNAEHGHGHGFVDAAQALVARQAPVNAAAGQGTYQVRAQAGFQAKAGELPGIVTLGLGLGCLQVFLEEGHRKDWLESHLIVGLGSIALVSLITFVILQFSRPNPLINLRILGNRNFGLSSIASLGMGVGLYGSIYLLPLYLAQVQGYNALQIGEVIMWMGIPQLFLIPLVPQLMKVVSPKVLCALGFCLFGAASFGSGVLNPGRVARYQPTCLRAIRTPITSP